MNPFLAFWYCLRGLFVSSHPDYELEFVEDNAYYAGERRPLKWELTRKDGSECAVPTSGTITVYSSGVAVATLTPDVESSMPAATQVVAALWTVPVPPGLYLAEIDLHIGSDTQIRSDRQLLKVT